MYHIIDSNVVDVEMQFNFVCQCSFNELIATPHAASCLFRSNTLKNSRSSSENVRLRVSVRFSSYAHCRRTMCRKSTCKCLFLSTHNIVHICSGSPLASLGCNLMRQHRVQSATVAKFCPADSHFSLFHEYGPQMYSH